MHTDGDAWSECDTTREQEYAHIKLVKYTVVEAWLDNFSRVGYIFC